MSVERQFQPTTHASKNRRAAHSVELYRSSSFAARKGLGVAGVRMKLKDHLHKTGGLKVRIFVNVSLASWRLTQSK
jgi:hypothetical protein